MKRKINFLTSYETKKMSESSVTQILFAVVTLFLIALSITASLLLKNRTVYIESQTANIESFLSSAEVIEVLSDVYLFETLALQYQELLDEYAADRASASKFISVEKQQILKAIEIGIPYIEVTGIEFSVDKGYLTLQCTAEDQRMPKDYVKRLRDSGMFDYVIYTGYTADGMAGSDALFSVNIYLKR